MPPAARISDHHTCPLHGGGKDATGEPTVLIGFRPAARVSDRLSCGGAVDRIAEGSPTVLIGHERAARMGDATTHGGVIVQGERTVLIGVPAQGFALEAAARGGVPFCEVCEQKRRAREDDGEDLEIEEYDGYFRVVQEGTDEPARGVRYRITRASGEQIEGTTDDEGRTRVVDTEVAELLGLEILDEPAEIEERRAPDADGPEGER
jgi:uncharacterized Zn-binding protein involved in type VI secretion